MNELGSLDFDQFHTVDLPERLAAGNGKLAAPALEGLAPIAFRLTDGRAYTYTPSADGMEIAPSDAGAHTVAELGVEDWHDFVVELRTCFALFYGDCIS